MFIVFGCLYNRTYLLPYLLLFIYRIVTIIGHVTELLGGFDGSHDEITVPFVLHQPMQKWKLLG